MNLKLAWRNIWRNPRRSLLTVAAIVFASALLVFMLSFQFGSYAVMIDTALKVNSGHMQIQAQGFLDKPDMKRVIEDPGAVAPLLDKFKDQGLLQDYTMRAETFALLSSNERTYGGLVMGVDPEREARVTNIKDIIRQGENLAPGDYDQALIGATLAKNLRLKLGDEFVVLGQGRDGSIAAFVYTIKGIFESGQDELDRQAVQIPLGNFDEVFSMRGAVHRMVLTAPDLDLLPELKQGLGKAVSGVENKYPLTVLDWKELLPGLQQSIQMDLFGGLILYTLLIIVVSFSILNTFLMAVFERTRELGVLMALGATPGRLSRILLLESGLTTLLGLILGIGLGAVVTLYFQSHGIGFSGDTAELMSHYGLPDRLYPRLSLLSASIGPGLVLLVTMFAALYPALKVRLLKPLKAMATA